jgi:DNA-binding response OmpR family regulator
VSEGCGGPYLVILDVNLPKLNGLQVLGELKRAGDVPVILLTGRGEEPDWIVGLDLGLQQSWGSLSEWQLVTTVTEQVRRLRQRVEPDPDHPHRLLSVRGVGDRFHS